MPQIIVDAGSRMLSERYALVRAPGRSRGRFHAGCVTLVESEAAALEGAQATQGVHAAVVYGPSVSSEGQRIFYLVRWLG